MSDYISRQAAIDALDKEYRYGGDIDRCGLATALDEIEDLPAAAVAPVVICKDCIHNNDCDIQYSAQAGENFFCGFGETEKDVKEDVYG